MMSLDPRRDAAVATWQVSRGLLVRIVILALLNAALPAPSHGQEKGLASQVASPVQSGLTGGSAPGSGIHLSAGDLLRSARPRNLVFHQQPPDTKAPPDSSPAEPKKRRRLALGIAGLGLAAAGAYLAATGYWVEPGKTGTQRSCTTTYIPDPSWPSLPGRPYQSCIDIPVIEKMPKAHTAQGTAGVAVATVGVVLAIKGFRRSR